MFNEDFKTAWQKRFSSEPPSEPFDPLFLRHRSVRDYSDREIPESTIQALVGAAQSAATSSNLQLWSVISIQNPELREQLAVAAADQRQVRSAPWFFAFLADHNRLRIAAQSVGENADGLDYKEFFTMAIIDVALAAERMVCAAESMGLSICYIGAMRNDPARIAELLNLPDGTFCPFGLCVGYPIEDATSDIKPRLAQDAVWFKERYPDGIDLAEYDDRMTAFYESQEMKADVTWSMRSGRRVDNHHLTGREVLKSWLESRGFSKR
ncbi:MAG: NADPH-dependent oxidoreductase [Fimbriimonadales bacterium]